MNEYIIEFSFGAGLSFWQQHTSILLYFIQNTKNLLFIHTSTANDSKLNNIDVCAIILCIKNKKSLTAISKLNKSNWILDFLVHSFLIWLVFSILNFLQYFLTLFREFFIVNNDRYLVDDHRTTHSNPFD